VCTEFVLRRDRAGPRGINKTVTSERAYRGAEMMGYGGAGV
jgi:hypothetical protein